MARWGGMGPSTNRASGPWVSVAETKVEMQRPMVEAYEAFLDQEGLCNLRTAARAVDAPERFFDWLKKGVGWSRRTAGSSRAGSAAATSTSSSGCA